jgi:hypothetical protein
MEAALGAAKDEAERERIERELKRLRDEQREQLEDLELPHVLFVSVRAHCAQVRAREMLRRRAGLAEQCGGRSAVGWARVLRTCSRAREWCAAP